MRRGAWRNGRNERSVTCGERCITNTGWVNRHRRQDEERIFGGPNIPKSSRHARPSVENGVITRRCCRAHIVVQSLIPRDDTGCKTAVFVPRDSAVNTRSSRRWNDAAGRADRVELEELKIHLLESELMGVSNARRSPDRLASTINATGIIIGMV